MYGEAQHHGYTQTLTNKQLINPFQASLSLAQKVTFDDLVPEELSSDAMDKITNGEHGLSF